MSSFNERFDPAREWEQKLRDKLRERGWKADLFGQGQLSDEWRHLLRGYADSYQRPALVRWMPDIITIVPTDLNTLAFIDAKTGTGNTGNYSVEINAHQAAKAFEDVFHVRVLFVWEDGGVLTTDDIEMRHCKRHDGDGTRGSGTPFYLVKNRFAAVFKDVFPYETDLF